MPVNETLLPTWQECQAHFNGSGEIAELFMYDASTHSCALINCTLVEQDEDMYRIAFRNSPTSGKTPTLIRIFFVFGIIILNRDYYEVLLCSIFCIFQYPPPQRCESYFIFYTK